MALEGTLHYFWLDIMKVVYLGEHSRDANFC